MAKLIVMNQTKLDKEEYRAVHLDLNKPTCYLTGRSDRPVSTIDQQVVYPACIVRHCRNFILYISGESNVFLNDKKVQMTRHVLNDCDKIRIGNMCQMMFVH